jgi:hypothetical protein
MMKQCEYCGNASIEEKWAESNQLVAWHRDGAHFFCSNECKLRFELEHPELEKDMEPHDEEAGAVPHPHAG